MSEVLTQRFVSTLHALAVTARTKRRERGQSSDPLISDILAVNEQSIDWFCSIPALHSFISQTSKLTPQSVVLPSDIEQYEQLKQQGRILSNDELDQTSLSFQQLPDHQAVDESQLRDQIHHLSSRCQTVESRLAQAQKLRDRLKQQVETARLQRLEQRSEIERTKRRIVVAEQDLHNQTSRMNESISAAVAAASHLSHTTLQIDHCTVFHTRSSFQQTVEQDINADIASYDDEAIQTSQRHAEVTSLQSMLDIAYRAQLKSRLQFADQQARHDLLLAVRSNERVVAVDSESIVNLRLRNAAVHRQLDNLKTSDHIKDCIHSLIQTHLTPIITRDQQAKIDRSLRRAARWEEYTKLAIQHHQISCCVTAALQSRWTDQLRRCHVVDQLVTFLKASSCKLDPSPRIESHNAIVTKEAALSLVQLDDLSVIIKELNGTPSSISEPCTHATVQRDWKQYSSRITSERKLVDDTFRWASSLSASLAVQIAALDRAASAFPCDMSRDRIGLALTLVDELGSKLNHLLELDAHRTSENRSSLMAPTQLVHDFFLQPQRILTVHRSLHARLLARQ